jgi:hypothetical protein
VGQAADIWPKLALSVVLAVGIPNLTLLALGRLDLAIYTSAGSLCALYAHGEPYAVRARVLLWVVVGMLAGTGISLTTAALTGSTVMRVVVASLLAAVYKMICDAARMGPPGGLIFIFITASCVFVPQRLADIPAHLSLVVLGGVIAWLVCMAPGLVRPDGPQRIATARALEAAARLLRASPSQAPRARHDAAAAANAAWHTLARVPARTPERAAARETLERLVIRAESALAIPPADTAEAGRLTAWARTLRRDRTPPRPLPASGQSGELAGIAVERAATRTRSETSARVPETVRGPRAVLAALRPGSPLLPIGARVAVGGLLAGWSSMALGVGRPYWAVVTAAAIFQANMTLTWRRALQRVIGNLVGLLVFTALLPLTRTGPVALVLTALVFQFGAEALISRNYWLGTVCVTPMALLMVELAGIQPAGGLVADRWLDTCVGAAVGLLSCVVVTNRRATDRIGIALDHLAHAETAARESLAHGGAGPYGLGPARARLATALVELRDAVDVAEGEWWQRALPEERITLAEREGHRLLARLTPAPAGSAGPGHRPAETVGTVVGATWHRSIGHGRRRRRRGGSGTWRMWSRRRCASGSASTPTSTPCRSRSSAG